VRCGAPLAPALEDKPPDIVAEPVEHTRATAEQAETARPEAQKLFKSAPPHVERYCPKCGALNDEGAAFCKSCRHSLAGGFYEPNPYAASPGAYRSVLAGAGFAEPETIPHALLPEASDGLGAIVSKALGIYTSNFGIVFGAYWLMSLVMFAAMFVVMFIAILIPFAGNIVQVAITPIFVGAYYVNLRTARGHAVDIGEAFSILAEKYVPMLIAMIIQTLILLIPTLAVVFAVFGSTFYQLMSFAPTAPPSPLGGFIGQIGWIIAAAVILGILQMFFVFVYPLIADDETDFWRAITTSVKYVWYNFWEVLWMMILATLIAISGALALFIGALFTAPLMYLIETAYYVARRDRFRALR
jgi:uncharacterized membrane protein